MMIDPPIDKLVEKVGCKYALVCLVSKRTKFLLDKKPDLIIASGDNPVTYVAKEVYNNKIECSYED